MKIDKVNPPPPPSIFQLQFSKDEGWTIVAALRDWYLKHPQAQDIEEVHQWAKDLDTELRK